MFVPITADKEYFFILFYSKTQYYIYIIRISFLLNFSFILPKLKGKNIVICNRYVDSTTAYQGYGRSLDLKLVETANNIATRGLKPDLTILLDLAPEEGLARKWRTKKEDHFERAELDFHRKVREGYLKLAANEPERFLVIDATQSKENVAEIIWQRVRQLIRQKNETKHV